MKTRKFLIASLLAAGFGQTSAAQDRLTGITSGANDGSPGSLLEQAYAREHLFTLAGHRSHSSHSSHSSHRSSYGGGGGHSSHTSHTSHRSSAGGYDYPSYVAPTIPDPPASNDNSTPTSRSSRGSGRSSEAQGLLSPRTDGPASPRAGVLAPLTGRSDRFKMIVCRVQVALAARDLYKGTIDCSVGPHLRQAIRSFQTSHGMEVTGTITPQVLDGLMVSTE